MKISMLFNNSSATDIIAKSTKLKWTFGSIFLVLLVIINLGYDLELINLKLHHKSNIAEPISLPLSRASTNKYTQYELSGNLIRGWFSPTALHITPDDGVEWISINGRPVDLSLVPRKSLNDWVHGFEIDVAEYLHLGTNSFTIGYWDKGGGGLMGMNVEYASQNTHLLTLQFMWLILLLMSVLLVAKHFKVSQIEWGLYFGVIIGSLAQVVLIFLYNPVDHIWSDPARHWEQGTDILRVDLMSMTDPVGYQVFIAALAKLTLKTPVLVAYYTSILALLAPWLWYRFFRELQPSKVLALAGWAFLSLLPSWMSIYSYFMQETLLLPLLGAALWASWRARRKGTLSSFLIMVILWTTAGLTRGIAIPLAAVICTSLWLTQGCKVQKAIFSTLILVLIMGPLTYRSYQTMGLFGPHGMGHLSSIYGMSGKKEIILHTEMGGSRWTHRFGSPSTGALPFKPINNWHTQRTGRVIVSVDFDNGKEDWDKAYDKIPMDWSKFLWVTKENLIFLFFGPSWPDNNQERLVDRLNIEMRWLWAPLFILCLVTIFLQRKKLKGQWLLPSVLVVWFLVQGLTPISVNEGRYRKPFEGLIVAQVLLLIAVSRRKYWKVREITRE